jgi:hypothetical protein
MHRAGGILLQLLAQPTDVHIHGLAVTDVIDAPNMLEQLVAAPHPAGVLHEQLQQPVLLGGEVHVEAVAGDPALLLI